jgi:hypothetical protein
MGFTLSSGNMFVILLNFISLFSAFCFYRSIFYCYHNTLCLSVIKFGVDLMINRNYNVTLNLAVVEILISKNYDKL